MSRRAFEYTYTRQSPTGLNAAEILTGPSHGLQWNWPLLEYLQQRAGDSLGAVEWYRGDEAELVYLRDDLDDEEENLRAKEIHQRLLAGEALSEPEQLSELGPHLATINLHEGAVLINLPVGSSTMSSSALSPR